MISLYWLALNLVAREPYAVQLVTPRSMSAVYVVLDLDATADERAILLSIGHHESRFNQYALNPDGDCGETQIRNPELWGSNCASILADRHEAYRVALSVIRYSQATCHGTWARVLTSYVSGKCGRAPMKARELCEPTGLCDTGYNGYNPSEKPS